MGGNRQQRSPAAPRARGVECEKGRRCSNPVGSRCSGRRDGGFDCFRYSYFNYEKKSLPPPLNVNHSQPLMPEWMESRE